MKGNRDIAAGHAAARRARLSAGAALGLMSSLGLTGTAGAAGGTGGSAGINFAGQAQFTGGTGGSGSGGMGGTAVLPGLANLTGGNGGTAYKGVGAYAGTGGGGGGTDLAAPNSFSGGAGGGIGQPGAPDAAGDPGGAAGANGNGAGAAQIVNAAPVAGGAGAPGNSNGGFGGGGSGGLGVLVTGSGASSNISTITGGAGGAGLTNSNNPFVGGGGGAGGLGAVFIASGVSFVNSGTVVGGGGGAGTSETNQPFFGVVGAGGGGGGAGGTGVVFLGGGAILTNNGTVSGGAGGFGAVPSANAFEVEGGGGGGEGGAGAIFVGDGSRLTNNGTITGGAGGAGDSVALTLGGGGGGAGGAGAIFVGNGVVAVNNATITGGAGGAGAIPVPGNVGGAGQGSAIGGGGGGGEGGAGIRFTGADASFTNAGMLSGGAGGSAGTALPSNGGGTLGGGGGGDGGAGAIFTGTGARFVNSGVVFGGAGGAGAPGLSIMAAGGPGLTTSASGTGGAGGAGVVFTAGDAVLTNAGHITGGNGGMSGGADSPAGVGGIGVVGNGITIDNRGGSIAGGFANAGAGAQNYAIQLNGGTNYVGTGGAITGGIYVAGGSLQPSLPGSRVGTPLAVTGPIAFAPGTFYNVRIRPTGNDSLVATGVGTLTGATVNVLAGNGVYRAGRRTILTADGGLGGTTFAGVTTNLAFLRPVLSYDANDVFLTIKGGGNYGIAAITYNQIEVAAGLTAAAAQHPGGAGARVLNALNQLTAPQARAAFDMLSGEGITGAQNIAYRSAQLFTSSIFDQTTFYGQGTANSVTLTERLPGFLSLAPSAAAPIRELADLPAVQPVVAVPVVARTWRAWATGFGGTEHISGNAFPIGSATQNNDIYGGALGVDYQLLPNYLVGVAVGGSNGDFRVAQRATSGTTTGGHVAFYDIATFGAFYGASSTSFSYFDNKTTRFVSGFGNLRGENEIGNFNSNEFRTRLEFGRHFAGLPGLNSFGTITPFVALELAELRSNGFTENSLNGPGLFRLNVSGQSAASAPGSIGFRFQRVADFGNGMVLSPTLQVAYLHEFAPYRSQIGTIISLPGSTFLVDGARPSRNAAQVKAGTELALGPRTAIFVNFDGEFSGVNQLYAGKGGFRYMW